MRILFVLPELPHPPFTGAHTRPLTLMRAAARAHEVAVVGAAPNGRRPQPRSASSARTCGSRTSTAAGPAGHRAPTPPAGGSSRRCRWSAPAACAASRSLVDEAVADWKPDAMVGETLYAAHYRVPDLPTDRRPARGPQRPLRVRGRGAAAALPRREPAGGHQPPVRAAPARRHHPGDHQRRRPRPSRHARRRGVHVPLAIDLPPEDALYDRASRARHDEAVRLLFIGSFVHEPNRDAARFLVRRLAPELRTERVPFAMVIAGLQAPPWLRKAGGAGVTVISDAPDLEPLYRSADIVLAPLPHGGGTKNKTLEAMAWGLPVLGTTQAFTGLPQLDGRAFVVRPARPAARAPRASAPLRDDPELRLHLGLARAATTWPRRTPRSSPRRGPPPSSTPWRRAAAWRRRRRSRARRSRRVPTRRQPIPAVGRLSPCADTYVRAYARPSSTRGVTVVRPRRPRMRCRRRTDDRARRRRQGRRQSRPGKRREVAIGAHECRRRSRWQGQPGRRRSTRSPRALGRTRRPRSNIRRVSPGIEHRRAWAARRSDSTNANAWSSVSGEVVHPVREHAGRAPRAHGAGGDVVNDTAPASTSAPSPISRRAGSVLLARCAPGGAPRARPCSLRTRAAHRVRVVGEDDVGPDEDVVLDGHELQEAAAVDAHAAADAIAELEHRVGADADVVAQAVALAADARALAGLQAVADDAAGVDGGERAHERRRRRW